MNLRLIFKNLGLLLILESVCMLPSLLTAFIYADGSAQAFIYAILITLLTGLAMRFIKPTEPDMRPKDGFATVGLGWVLIVLFGTLPFLFSGAIPRFEDAFFETISGFSTTGSTILSNVEILPKGVLFWRSFTNWVGGMGILVLMLAILPSGKGSYVHIMNAESTGPLPDKMLPKIREVAKTLYTLYFFLSVIQLVLLLVGRMPLFDAFLTTFSTAGTGGFSPRNASIAAYGSTYIEVIVGIFMFLFGINFSLYHLAGKRKIREILHDEEVRFYVIVVAVSTALIALNILPIYGSITSALDHSFFQVSSVISTTGFSTADFNLWPAFSQCILVILMFFGACAGSTAGGIKCIRILLLFKIAKREVDTIVHPNSIKTVKYNGRSVSEKSLSTVVIFFFIFMAVTAIATLLVSLDGKDLTTTFTAVATCVGNVGPGLGEVGPTGNFASFSPFSKYVLSFCMFVGRLEVFPVLILLAPSLWSENN